MAINIVFCADDAERRVAMDALKAAGNVAVSFSASDGMAATATVSGNRLVQGTVSTAAFVVVGTPSASGG